jgi:signal transduction histidine kinase
MQIGTLILDAGGIVLWADPLAHALLTMDNQQCTERPLAEVIHLSGENRARLAGFLASGQGAVILQQGTSDGETLVARLSALGCSTARGGAQQYRCRLSMQDDALVERTALAAVQLRSTIQSIIAGFAHEVRNPLAAILSIAESSLQNVTEPTHVQSELERIPALVERIESLIHQAMDYSRPSTPKKKSFPVLGLVNNALDMLKTKYQHVDIVTDVSDDLPLVLVDSGQIERTLINLLDNACCVARSRVTLVARRASGPTTCALLVDIRDDGPGIPEGIQKRIFEPFFTTKAKGTGLGLAIARDLARINGGDLRLRSSGSEGTVFRLCLALAPSGAQIKEAS